MSDGKKLWITLLVGALIGVFFPVGFLGDVFFGAIMYLLLTALYGTENKEKQGGRKNE